MPSNFDLDLEARIEAHFTGGELCEFLGITVQEIIEAFPEAIQASYRELLEEV